VLEKLVGAEFSGYLNFDYILSQLFVRLRLLDQGSNGTVVPVGLMKMRRFPCTGAV